MVIPHNNPPIRNDRWSKGILHDSSLYVFNNYQGSIFISNFFAFSWQIIWKCQIFFLYLQKIKQYDKIFRKNRSNWNIFIHRIGHCSPTTGSRLHDWWCKPHPTVSSTSSLLHYANVADLRMGSIHNRYFSIS